MPQNLNETELESFTLHWIERLRRYVAMAIILPHPSAGPNDVIDNGTAFFLKTPAKHLLVTCAHVHDGFEKILQEHNDAVIKFSGISGSAPFGPLDLQLIDKDSGLDIAVYSVQNPSDITANGKDFFEVWPATKPTIGERILTLGYPGLHRYPTTVRETHGLQIHLDCFTETLKTDPSDRQFILADENVTRKPIKYKEQLKDFGEMGGFSGSPAFIIEDESPHFCGIFKNSGALARFSTAFTVGEQTGEMEETDEHAPLVFGHASYLLEDGTFDRGLMPWT